MLHRWEDILCEGVCRGEEGVRGGVGGCGMCRYVCGGVNGYMVEGCVVV